MTAKKFDLKLQSNNKVLIFVKNRVIKITRLLIKKTNTVTTKKEIELQIKSFNVGTGK